MVEDFFGDLFLVDDGAVLVFFDGVSGEGELELERESGSGFTARFLDPDELEVDIVVLDVGVE